MISLLNGKRLNKNRLAVICSVYVCLCSWGAFYSTFITTIITTIIIIIIINIITIIITTIIIIIIIVIIIIMEEIDMID